MRIILVALLVSGAFFVASTESFRPLNRRAWRLWKRAYNKTYSSSREEMQRALIFHHNLKFIRWHNERYRDGDVFYKVGLNAFADLTLNEFADTYMGLQAPPDEDEEEDCYFKPESFLTNESAPESFDWRKHDCVTPVKDQGQCGACWAFSVAGALEGQYKIKKGELLDFSEQQLVDCSQEEGNEGCKGGMMEKAYEYWMKHGVASEKTYPYTGKDSSCRYNASAATSKISKFVRVEPCTEYQLKIVVSQVGPVSAAIDARTSGFQFYKSGIYDDDDCLPDILSLGVLVVGYDENESGDKYWILKNNWGTGWGNKGYVWLARDNDNRCGITTMATYPVL